MQAGLKVSDVGHLLQETLNRWGPPAAIVCDRWREAELRQELVKQEYPVCPLVVRGMGFRMGARMCGSSDRHVWMDTCSRSKACCFGRQ